MRLLNNGLLIDNEAINRLGMAGETHNRADGAGYSDGGVLTMNAENIGDISENFVRLRQPYFNDRGRPTVLLNTGRMVTNKEGKLEPERRAYPTRWLQDYGINSPVLNATTLRKEEWIHLDQVILREARKSLRAWADLAASSSYGGFNGMATQILEYEAMSDAGAAYMDMDGLTQGTADTPLFQLRGMPLPMLHADFWYSGRQLATSRKTGTPLDTTMGEMAGRRVAELLEMVTIGVMPGLAYGGNSTYVGGYDITSQVFGYLNYPHALSYTGLTNPTANGWTPATLIGQILAMRSQLWAQNFKGPFMLYHSIDWDQYLDGDYILSTSATSGNVTTMTLRERLQKIQGIQDVRRLDFMPGSTAAGGKYTLVLVQMTPDVAQAVNGMDLTTLQWESKGGMQVNFKVLAIQAPRLRCTQSFRCGILTALSTT